MGPSSHFSAHFALARSPVSATAELLLLIRRDTYEIRSSQCNSNTQRNKTDLPGRDSLEDIRRYFGSVWQQLRVVEDLRMFSVQLEVEFVAARQMLPDGAHAAAADDQRNDDDVDQVRRPRRRLTRPHFHHHPAPHSFTQRVHGSANPKTLTRGRTAHLSTKNSTNKQEAACLNFILYVSSNVLSASKWHCPVSAIYSTQLFYSFLTVFLL